MKKIFKITSLVMVATTSAYILAGQASQPVTSQTMITPLEKVKLLRMQNNPPKLYCGEAGRQNAQLVAFAEVLLKMGNGVRKTPIAARSVLYLSPWCVYTGARRGNQFHGGFYHYDAHGNSGHNIAVYASSMNYTNFGPANLELLRHCGAPRGMHTGMHLQSRDGLEGCTLVVGAGGVNTTTPQKLQ